MRGVQEGKEQRDNDTLNLQLLKISHSLVNTFLIQWYSNITPRIYPLLDFHTQITRHQNLGKINAPVIHVIFGDATELDDVTMALGAEQAQLWTHPSSDY